MIETYGEKIEARGDETYEDKIETYGNKIDTNLWARITQAAKRMISVANPPKENTEEYLQNEFSKYGKITNIELFEVFNTFNALITYEGVITLNELHGCRQKNNVTPYYLGRSRLYPQSFWRYCIVGIINDENESENSLYEKYEKYGKISILFKVAQHVYIKFENSNDNLLLIDHMNADGHNFTPIIECRYILHCKLMKTRVEYLLDWNKNVIVGNLSPTFSEHDLRLYFAECGKNIYIGKIAEYTKDTACAKVTFADAESVSLAVAKNLTLYKNRHITVFEATTNNLPNYSKSMFVSNLPKNVNDEAIYNEFSKFGNLQSINRQICIINKKSSEDVNMVVITYSDIQTIQKFMNGEINLEGQFEKVLFFKCKGPCFDFNVIRENEIKNAKHKEELWNHVPEKLVHIGNPPLKSAEKSIRQRFTKFGKIEKVKIYFFRGSYNALIYFHDPVDESIENVTDIEGHPISTHIVAEPHNETIYENTLVSLLGPEDEKVTETELFEKFIKYGEVIEINKVFPHVYIKFSDNWNFDRIIEKCKIDQIECYKIAYRYEKIHKDIIFDRRICEIRQNGIIVTNISPHMTIAEIKKYFEELYSKIECISFLERYNYQSYRVVIKFYRSQLYKKYVMYKGRRLFIFDIYSIIPNYKTSVLVSRLPDSLLEEDIYQNFEQFGPIESIIRHTLNNPQLAIITFQNEKSANDAVFCKTFTFKNRLKNTEMYDIIVEKSIGVCFQLNPEMNNTLPHYESKGLNYQELRSSFLDGNKLRAEEQKIEFHEFIKPRSLHIANPPTDDNCEELLNKTFSKYGKIKEIQTYKCPGDTNNALITFCKPIKTDFMQLYRGTWMKNKKICATGLAEPNNIINTNTLCGLVDDDNITENEMYAKFRKYGTVLQAIRVGQHIYLNYVKEEVSDVFIKCNADGIILFRIPEECLFKHYKIFRSRVEYQFLKCKIIAININTLMKWVDMHKLFSGCGEIAHFQYCYSKSDGCEKNFVITFKTEEAVEKAMSTINNSIHQGNRIFIIDISRKQIPNYKCTVLIKDLKPRVPINTIYDFFIQYGPIESILKEPKLLIAYITFKSEESANAAMTCTEVPDTLSSTGTISVEKSIGLSFDYNLVGQLAKADAIYKDAVQKKLNSNQNKTSDQSLEQQQNMNSSQNKTSEQTIDQQQNMTFEDLNEIPKDESYYLNYLSESHQTSKIQSDEQILQQQLNYLKMQSQSSVQNRQENYPIPTSYMSTTMQKKSIKKIIHPIIDVSELQIPKEPDSTSTKNPVKDNPSRPFTITPEPIVQPTKPKINWPFRLQFLKRQAILDSNDVESSASNPAPVQAPVPTPVHKPFLLKTAPVFVPIQASASVTMQASIPTAVHSNFVPVPMQTSVLPKTAPVFVPIQASASATMQASIPTAVHNNSFPVPMQTSVLPKKAPAFVRMQASASVPMQASVLASSVQSSTQSSALVKTSVEATTDPASETYLVKLIKSTHKFKPIQLKCLTLPCVYISNLSFEATRNEILDLFNQCAPVSQFVFIDSPYCTFMDPPARIAYAYFDTIGKCKKVAEKVDKQMLHGKRINVILGRARYPMTSDRLIRVKNLSVIVTEEMLYDKYICCGPITRISKISQNEAYIFFEKKAGRNMAIHKQYNFKQDSGGPIAASLGYKGCVDFKLVQETFGLWEETLIKSFNELKTLPRIDETIIMNSSYYMITGCLPVNNCRLLRKYYKKNVIHWLIGVGITENLCCDFDDDIPENPEELNTQNIEKTAQNVGDNVRNIGNNVSTISNKVQPIRETIDSDVAVFKKDELQKLLDLAFSRGKNAVLEVAAKNIVGDLKKNDNESTSRYSPSRCNTLNQEEVGMSLNTLHRNSNNSKKATNQPLHNFPGGRNDKPTETMIMQNRERLISDLYNRNRYSNQSGSSESFMSNRNSFNPNFNINQPSSSNSRNFYENRITDDVCLPKRSRPIDNNQDFTNQFFRNSTFVQNRIGDDDHLPKRSRFIDNNQEFLTNLTNQIWDNLSTNNNSNVRNIESNFTRNVGNFSRNDNNFGVSPEKRRRNW